MTLNITGIEYFMPLFAFLIVFVVMFAILNKTKIMGENPWVQLFLSFLVSTIFVSAAGVREYVLVITPWFAVLLISLFFILLILGFIGKQADFMYKGTGLLAIIVLVIIFLVSGFVVFSEYILSYLSNNLGGSNMGLFDLTREIYKTRVFGALLLLGISAIVSWVLVKGK